MKNKLYLATAGAVALALLIATPVLAQGSNDSNGDLHASLSDNNGLHLGSVISLFAHEDQAISAGQNTNTNTKNDSDLEHGTTTPTVQGTDQDSDSGGTDENGRDHTSAVLNTQVGAGIVSSVTGTSFTINPFRGSGTTTVTTDASTTFKGGATSTGSLGIGSKVIVVGNASTTTPGSFMASIVILINNGFSGLRHFFFD